MSQLVVFDDRDFEFQEHGRPVLAPISDLRAFFEIRTGMLTTIERLMREAGRAVDAVFVPERLRALVNERIDVPVNLMPDPLSMEDGRILCLNGRWSFPGAAFEIHTGQALVEVDSGAVVAAELERRDAEDFLNNGRLPGDVEQIGFHGQLLIRRSWEILGQLHRNLVTDLLTFCNEPTAPIVSHETGGPPAGVIVLGTEPISLAPDAEVYPTVVLDAEKGPIVIAPGVTVRPGAIICGPCFIGPGTTVLDRALIKANTSIGPMCKVAGEVGTTVIQSFSNKAHDGHLGDSFLGEWVNLGAGTTNSNLLNTYGEVSMRLRPHDHKEKTGMQFLGAIIGDHAKLAINTRLMTGTVIGTGAMIACSDAPPTCVHPFAWCTGDLARTYRLERFIEVAEHMMERRDQTFTKAMRHRIEALYNLEVSSS